MHTVAFVGVGILLMAEIPVYVMMVKLQCSYPERRDDIVEMLGIDLNRIIHQLIDGHRRQTFEDSDSSDMTIQGAFIR